MSQVQNKGAFVFHTDLGPVVVEQNVTKRFDIEDVIRNRAISQAQAVAFLNLGQAASPNDVTGARTVSSKYSQSTEELPD